MVAAFATIAFAILFSAPKKELIYCGFTDSDGKIILDNLPLGKYYIIETIAKEGYQLSYDKQEFEITNNMEVVSVTRNNTRIVKVPKTDSYDYVNKSAFTLFIFGLTNIFYDRVFRKNKFL